GASKRGIKAQASHPDYHSAQGNVPANNRP
ncbi:MAG: hypothetical protein JWO25_1456, partial [Alphaproteobacteria bacterium]|nr:hypothetical protein [Alphaproteobacteria bacterium]